ncbi:DUF4383 domain-containing protein [Corynebacterium sp. A21]|uniref:DUF4383 domain-containing protein n=1 Tax=Corynebacterium sp. A21 TaxID=3457318 RepID=UPI003FD5A839
MATFNRSGALSGRSPLQIIAIIYGIVFLLVGIAGFIPGLTSNLDTLHFAGHEGNAMLLGIFHVSILHNIVHLLFGVAGIVLSRTPGSARHFLLWGGLIYLALFLYGLFVDVDSAANFVPLNDANNWLHLGLGATMLVLSFLPRLTRDARTPEEAATMSTR